MTKTKTIIIFLIFFFGVLGFGKSSWAAVNLPWSTTYNCGDWLQYSDPLNCNGLDKGGGWTDSEGHYEQIISGANYSGGAGGKGQRHWLGPAGSPPGKNDNSGGTYIYYSGQSEFWARWYIRFENGFFWTEYNGFKVLYFQGVANIFYLGYPGAHGMSYYTQEGDTTHWKVENFGWEDSWGATSDGSWHCFEIHIKSETAPNYNNGVFQCWVDGILRMNFNTINHGMASTGRTMTGFMIGSNCSGLAGLPRCMYVDYDDIAVSNTGYIGPIESLPDTTPPAPPSGVTIS